MTHLRTENGMLVTDCPTCGGRGWYCQIVEGTEDDCIPDAREVYCTCKDGKRRRDWESWKP